MSSPYPEPPPYWRSGGPWTPPVIPTTRKEARQEEIKTARNSLSGSSIREKLEKLLGSGKGEIGVIATHYANVLFDVANHKNTYQDHINSIKGKMDELWSLVEEYNQLFSIAELIASLKAQTEERKAATAYLEETVNNVKGKLREEALALQGNAR